MSELEFTGTEFYQKLHLEGVVDGRGGRSKKTFVDTDNQKAYDAGYAEGLMQKHSTTSEKHE